MPLRSLTVPLLVVALVTASGGVAAARGRRHRAATTTMAAGRSDFQRGEQFYAEGHFFDAAQAFEVAYQRSNNYVLLWNVARAYHRQYEVDADITNLRRERAVLVNYMQIARLPREYREAKLRLAEVDAALDGAVRAMMSRPGAAQPGAQPRPQSGPMIASTTTVPDAATATPVPAEGARTAAPLATPLSPAAPSPLAPPAPAPANVRARIAAGYSLLGVGGALAIGAIVCGVLGSGDAAAIEAAKPQSPASFDLARGTQTAGQRDNQLAYAGIGLGAAALVTGAILVAPWQKLHHGGPPRVTVAPLPGGFVVGGVW